MIREKFIDKIFICSIILLTTSNDAFDNEVLLKVTNFRYQIFIKSYLFPYNRSNNISRSWRYLLLISHWNFLFVRTNIIAVGELSLLSHRSWRYKGIKKEGEKKRKKREEEKSNSIKIFVIYSRVITENAR